MRSIKIKITVAIIMGFLSCSPTMAQQGFYGRTRYAYSKTVGDFDFITMNDGGGIGTSLSGPSWVFDSSNGDVTTQHPVGIGTNDPADRLDVTGGGLQIQEQADSFAIVNTTQIGIVKFYGDDDTASADAIAGQIEVIATGTWTNGAEDAKMVLSAVDNGTLNANQLVLETNGHVAIGGAEGYLVLSDRSEVVLAGDVIGGVLFRSYDASSFGGNSYAAIYAKIELVAIDDLTSFPSADTAIIFSIADITEPDSGLPVTPVEAMRILQGGDVIVAKSLGVEDVIFDKTSTDVMWPSKSVIKTFGIAGSGLDFTFSSVANTTEQQLDLGALLPAGCVIVSVVLECDVTVTDGADQTMSIDVGITAGTAALLTASDTDSDGQTNVTAAGSSPTLAHSTTARNVWANAIPGVNWSALTGGEWSVIIRYDDLGAVRVRKGL